MRVANWLAVGMLLCLGAGSARAQFFGVDPRKLDYKIIDTKTAVAPVPFQTRQTSFKLMDLLPSFSFNFGKPVVGQSDIPSPKKLLKALNYHNPYRKN